MKVLYGSKQGKVHILYITDKGKGFILQGGYAKQDNDRKQEKIEKWKTSTINWIMALVIAIASSIITLIVTKLLS